MPLGYHHSEESKEKNRRAHLGKRHSEETRRKRSEFMRGRYIGDKAPWWKSKVTYAALHYRIRKVLSRPDLCVVCNIKPSYDVANISGEYKYTLDDWMWVCRSCHMRRDGRIHNLKHN